MLAQLRSSLTYANVMATVAVFVALGGTSYAVATGSIDSRELKDNTVRSKDVRNNDVSTRDLRNNSARGVDVRNNSLTGQDILESSLGAVPSANSANTATHASTASSASALGGLGADAFLRADLATIRNPVSVDDPAGDGLPTRTTLMTAGPVTIRGRCNDVGDSRNASITGTASSAGAQIVRPTGTQVLVVDQEDTIVGIGNSSAQDAVVSTFALHHPGSGTYRWATAFVSINSVGDCGFAITAFG